MKRVQFPPFSTHANFQDQVIHSQLSVILATSEYSKWIIFVAERQISVHISEFPIPCCPMGKRSWSLASVGCSGSGMRAAKEICKWVSWNLNYRLECDLHYTFPKRQCILRSSEMLGSHDTRGRDPLCDSDRWHSCRLWCPTPKVWLQTTATQNN